MKISIFSKLFKNIYLISFCLSVAIVACSDSKVYLIRDISQTNANSAILLLEQNSIETQEEIQKDGTYNILISNKDKVSALKLLNQSGLPRVSFTTLGEEFKKDGFISSPMEEQSRYIFALQQEISNTISQINGVISVNTQISLPPPSDNLWQGSVVYPSASVLIKYMHGYRVDLYTNKLKALITNSIPGLTADRVSILMISVNNG